MSLWRAWMGVQRSVHESVACMDGTEGCTNKCACLCGGSEAISATVHARHSTLQYELL